MFRVRVRTSSQTVDLQVSTDATIQQFKQTVSERIDIPVDAQLCTYR